MIDFSALRPGEILRVNIHGTCLERGELRPVKVDTNGEFYVLCSGRHCTAEVEGHHTLNERTAAQFELWLTAFGIKRLTKERLI